MIQFSVPEQRLDLTLLGESKYSSSAAFWNSSHCWMLTMMCRGVEVRDKDASPTEAEGVVLLLMIARQAMGLGCCERRVLRSTSGFGKEGFIQFRVSWLRSFSFTYLSTWYNLEDVGYMEIFSGKHPYPSVGSMSRTSIHYANTDIMQLWRQHR